MTTNEINAVKVIDSLLELINDLQPDPEYDEYYGVTTKTTAARDFVQSLFAQPGGEA